MRKGWKVMWPDGTTWLGDCPKWAAAPLGKGNRIIPIRIMGAKRWPCPACIHGTSH
jgi:hypothetical protein